MKLIKIFLCGDVMLGRGIDQVLPHPGDPTLHEPYVRSAQEYVRLAEAATGPIPRPVSFEYVWGDALYELERMALDIRIINLETSITTSNSYWKTKEVHYKMNPANIPCITSARINCCSLANNHVMDWGYQGLAETLGSLKRAKIKSSGAGMNLEEAQWPAIIETGRGRVLVFSFGSTTSGIPLSWAAEEGRPGVNLLMDFSSETVSNIGKQVQETKQAGDIAIASIHWGSNWGYEIPREWIEFAHKLIDIAGIDVVYGHSSHHVKGIEVYHGKPILYGCGDFLNDYEGISGHEVFRGDLGLMYFLTMDASTGNLSDLLMTPTQVRHFCVIRALPEDTRWLEDILNRESAKFETGVEKTADGALTLGSLPIRNHVGRSRSRLWSLG